MSYQYRIEVRNIQLVKRNFDGTPLPEGTYDAQIMSVLPEGAILWVHQSINPQGYRWEVQKNGNIQYANIRLHQHTEDNPNYTVISIQRPDDGEHDVYVTGSLRLQGDELDASQWIFKWIMPPELELLERDRYGHDVYRMPNS